MNATNDNEKPSYFIAADKFASLVFALPITFDQRKELLGAGNEYVRAFGEFLHNGFYSIINHNQGQ